MKHRMQQIRCVFARRVHAASRGSEMMMTHEVAA